MKTKRQVNFELLRIFCMYMIVIGHCLFHGRVTAKLGYGTVNYFLSYFVQSFSVVHVNCFVMIGGYFAVGSEFRSARVLRFWRQVSFYALLIFALYGCLASVSLSDAVKALFPISAYNYWFASVYMGLLLLTPFIGMLATRLTKAQYRWLLVCLTIFFSVNHMIFRVNSYGSYSGRELPWFIFLALLAGYIRLHTEQKKKYFYCGLAGYVLSSLAILASVYLSVELGAEDISYFLNYNSPLALLSTACLFLAVKNMPWKETRADGLIRKIAGAAFGVYLIHDNYLIRYLVWDTFRASKVALTHWAVIYAAVVAVVVYAACTCLELLRQKLFVACGERYERTALCRKEQELCGKIDEIFTKTMA
ncbi:MAG: acyltransferase [Lachnospiraceae bacterium]|nr:acyltransferase [Lachnospiraceae bacterium]